MSADAGRAEPPDPARLRDLVREWILAGDAGLDVVLTVPDVVDRTGAHPADVRTALDRLAEEGTLTVSADYRARVAVPSPAVLAETDALRCELEGLAARRFVGNASAAQREAMRRAVHDFRELAGRCASAGDLLRAHDRFYHVLLRAAGGINTLRLLGELRARVAVVVCAGLADPARAWEMAEELSAIHDALAADDVERAVAACARHVIRTSEAGLDRLGLALT